MRSLSNVLRMRLDETGWWNSALPWVRVTTSFRHLGALRMTCSSMLLLGGALGTPAQDIHFSQFMAAPLHNSPALTGLFNGDYRVMANYRSQWGSFTQPYRTFAVAGDMILGRGLSPSDFVGVGLWAFSDKAGDIAMSTSQATLAIAYHKGLSDYASHFISVGVQVGIGQRGFDVSKVTLDNQFDGISFNPGILPGEHFARSSIIFLDMATGVSWYYSPGDRSNVYAGGGIFHFNDPNQSFMDDVFPLDRRYTAFAGGKLPLGTKLSVHPSILMHRQGLLSEVVIGGYLRAGLNHISNSRESALAFGGAMRSDDALIFTTLVEYDALNVGLSYDINLSRLTTASTGRGGPELSVSYVIDHPGGERSRRLKGKPMNCPEF